MSLFTPMADTILSIFAFRLFLHSDSKRKFKMLLKNEVVFHFLIWSTPYDRFCRCLPIQKLIKLSLELDSSKG